MSLYFKKYTNCLRKGEISDALKYREDIHTENIGTGEDRADAQIKDKAVDAALSDKVNRTSLYRQYRENWDSIIPEEPDWLISKRRL